MPVFKNGQIPVDWEYMEFTWDPPKRKSWVKPIQDVEELQESDIGRVKRNWWYEDERYVYPQLERYLMDGWALDPEYLDFRCIRPFPTYQEKVKVLGNLMTGGARYYQIHSYEGTKSRAGIAFNSDSLGIMAGILFAGLFGGPVGVLIALIVDFVIFINLLSQNQPSERGFYVEPVGYRIELTRPVFAEIAS